MKMQTKCLSAAILAGLCLPTLVSASTTTPDVALGSVYYSYIEKLSGMGYITDMPTGAKPYSRQQMAHWVQQAEEIAKTKPMPVYLQDQLKALQKYLAPELAYLQGRSLDNPLHLSKATIGLRYNNADHVDYPYNSWYQNRYQGHYLNARWQPFSAGNNGYDHGTGTNYMISAQLEGNITNDIALSITPRFDYDHDHQNRFSLEEAYVKAGVGAWDITAGRQALTWGQGAAGNLLLGNSMKPLTTLQFSLKEPKQVGGFFKFLGKVDFHAFYTQLEGNRAEIAKANSHNDFNHPQLLGLRFDVTPTSYATFGLSRISMLGGQDNSLSISDYGKWLIGENAYSNDKWDDIAGFDFRLRFPGAQVYGELYGEDQAGYLPSDIAYRLGVYLPNIAADGAWDLTLETAKTNRAWYVHSRYQNGWTYSGHIMGDMMGLEGQTYYAKLQHYLPNETQFGLYAKRTEFDRTLTINPTVDEIGITGQYKLRQDLYLNGLIGWAHIKNAPKTGSTETTTFLGGSLSWIF